MNTWKSMLFYRTLCVSLKTPLITLRYREDVFIIWPIHIRTTKKNIIARRLIDRQLTTLIVIDITGIINWFSTCWFWPNDLSTFDEYPVEKQKSIKIWFITHLETLHWFVWCSVHPIKKFMTNVFGKSLIWVYCETNECSKSLMLDEYWQWPVGITFPYFADVFMTKSLSIVRFEVRVLIYLFMSSDWLLCESCW